MPRWKAVIKGTLHFNREITVYACNEHDAAIVAEELTEKSTGEYDHLHIERIDIISLVPDEDMQFEILLKEKK